MMTFMPVCLYARTLYRRKAKLLEAFKKYIDPSESALVLICDEIHTYHLMSSRSDMEEETARSRAYNQGKNISAMVANVASEVGCAERTQIKRWLEVAESPDYEALHRRVEADIEADEGFGCVIGDFVQSYVSKFHGSRSERVQAWERKYITAEVTMSVFATEKLGYCREVWEAPPPLGHVDPLGYLYRERRELLSKWTGVPDPRRQLEIIAWD